MPFEILGGGFAGLSVLAFAFTILHIAVVVGCALAINDSNRRMEVEGRQPEMLSSMMWVLAALVGGMVTLGLYWAMHFSTLSRRI
jgi:uncharacterized protein HemY